jgi:hypothetical protein
MSTTPFPSPTGCDSRRFDATRISLYSSTSPHSPRGFPKPERFAPLGLPSILPAESAWRTTSDNECKRSGRAIADGARRSTPRSAARGAIGRTGSGSPLFRQHEPTGLSLDRDLANERAFCPTLFRGRFLLRAEGAVKREFLSSLRHGINLSAKFSGRTANRSAQPRRWRRARRSFRRARRRVSPAPSDRPIPSEGRRSSRDFFR